MNGFYNNVGKDMNNHNKTYNNTNTPIIMASEGYNPNRTRVCDNTQVQWLRSNVTGKVTEVPGVGEATARIFENCEDRITTTYQLMGKFLSFKDANVGPIEHADRFFYWLTRIGTVAGQRSSVVRAIAEKLHLQFPDIYDPDAYDVENSTEEDKVNVNSNNTMWYNMQNLGKW